MCLSDFTREIVATLNDLTSKFCLQKGCMHYDVVTTL